MHLQTLHDNWSIRPCKKFAQGSYPPATNTGWHPIAIPSHWQELPELATHAGNVIYRCDFALDDTSNLYDEHIAAFGDAARTWLRFNGVFYWAQPYLNGTDLGCHEGYFEPFEHDVTDLLRLDNTLLVEVACPNERNKTNKRMITGVFSHWDCLDPQANPGGIWLPVELHRSGPVRVQTVRCHSETCHERFAQLRYDVTIHAATAGQVVLRWSFVPHTFTGETQVIEQRRNITQGEQEIGGLLKLRDPRLWWTHDLGNPDLYTCTLDIVWDEHISDSRTFRFGIRQFELRNWIPYLNGVRFLAKGNNYAPGDMRIANMNAQRYAADMQLARDAHMNMLRVHAHIEHPAFYDAADEAGILLWQDMPLQWLYQAKVLPEAKRQTRAMIQLLGHHPAVAIWCMHNEPIYISDSSDETMFTRFRTYQSVVGFSWNRDVLDKHLKRVAEQTDPSRPIIRSSGEVAIPPFGQGTDAHVYFGWYQAYGTLQDAEKFFKFMQRSLQFVTEFGAQSFPNSESCRRFMPEDVHELDTAQLAQRHGFQPEVMSRWLPWRTAHTLDELVTMTQDYQIAINRYYIDRLRYHKYTPTGGILAFLFCDPFPAVLWSVVDYWRVPKQSYSALQQAFSPQYVFTLLLPQPYHVADRIDLPIYVVNDAQEVCEQAQVRATLYGTDGQELATIQHTIMIEADCQAQEVDKLRFIPEQSGQYTLELELTNVPYAVRQSYRIEIEA
jgi:beta-mannosidase